MQHTQWKHASIQVIVDGVLQEGSFTKIKNFSLKGGTQIVETPIIGEDVDVLNRKRMPYSFGFEHETVDSAAWDLAETLDERDRLKQPTPAITIIVTREYISPSVPARTVTLPNVQLVYEDESGSGDDFVTTKWSGKVRRPKWR